MIKKTNTRTFITGAFAAAAIMVGISVNDASASPSNETPSQVTRLAVPAQGLNADNLIDQLKPLGFNKVYAVKENNDFFHLMAQDHFGDIKHLWIGKSDGKTAIF